MPEESSSRGGLMAFLWRNKIWWITPAVAVLLLVGALYYLSTRSPATSPFTYTLF